MSTIITKKQEEIYYDSKSTSGIFDAELKWLNLIAILIFHVIFVWALLAFPYSKGLKLLAWGFLVTLMSGFGVTAGAHRLWCHRSYKATALLRVILMVWYTSAGMNSIYHWVRDHRVHHKYNETDADPHDIRRGFFFAHVGWIMMKKHPEVLRRGQEINMSDILADPVVQFHERYFILLKILLAFIIPSIIPPLCWGDDLFMSVVMICIIRYCLLLNGTWSVNSAAHLWGQRPYDKKLWPAENKIVSAFALGEGWHNYHHVFPWDYKTSELGIYGLNFTTFLIDTFAKLGLAYDLKVPSEKLIKQAAERKGDGSHPVWGYKEIPEDSELADNKLN